MPRDRGKRESFVDGTDHRFAPLFRFEEREGGVLRSAPSGGPLFRLFGGQVLAQALAAAQHSVAAGRLAHSCHAYFVRAGRVDRPIDFSVSRDTDGRSFSARRVEARQGDELILTLSASFHDAEPGPVQQAAMPDVPDPLDLPPQDDAIAAALPDMPPHRVVFWDRDIGIDFRAVEPFRTVDPPRAPPRRSFWFRTRDRLGDDPGEHQRMLAFASDLYILHTGLLPLGISWSDHGLNDASLDHALWFHQPFRADEWLLYTIDSPYAGGARTLGRGTIFARDGRLVASVAQEGLIRLVQ
ncbi:acyl-CoA thioesterase II [Sphingomonas histidinilytica]|nr:acyl-CoA thioesterase II [Rhizorhabdus histidinilytica]